MRNIVNTICVTAFNNSTLSCIRLWEVAPPTWPRMEFRGLRPLRSRWLDFPLRPVVMPRRYGSGRGDQAYLSGRDQAANNWRKTGFSKCAKPGCSFRDSGRVTGKPEVIGNQGTHNDCFIAVVTGGRSRCISQGAATKQHETTPQPNATPAQPEVIIPPGMNTVNSL